MLSWAEEVNVGGLPQTENTRAPLVHLVEDSGPPSSKDQTRVPNSLVLIPNTKVRGRVLYIL